MRKSAISCKSAWPVSCTSRPVALVIAHGSPRPMRTLMSCEPHELLTAIEP